jgi:glyoxylase I family protein
LDLLRKPFMRAGAGRRQARYASDHLSGAAGIGMIRLGEIDHVVLRAIDMTAMQRFYCNVLGCREERRQDEIDLVSIEGKLGRHGGAAPAGEGHNMDHLCLRVVDYDEAAILAHLKAHGVRIGESGSRYGAQGEGPSIYLYDPQGNRVELKGPPTRSSLDTSH